MDRTSGRAYARLTTTLSDPLRGSLDRGETVPLGAPRDSARAGSHWSTSLFRADTGDLWSRSATLAAVRAQLGLDQPLPVQ
jgi:hypothetical protein